MARTRDNSRPVDPADKIDFKKIFPIFMVVLIDLLGVTIIIPLLPLYARTFGADAFTIGVLGATYPVMQFIGAPVLGRLSDRYGRKPVLVFSQIGTFAGFILLGLAGSLPILFVSRVIDGLSGANVSTAQAMITDSTTERNRTQGLGLIGAAFGLGFVIGPVIAFLALALSNNNYAMPAFVAAGFSLISIFLSVFKLQETLPLEKRGAGPARASALSMRTLFTALRHPSVGLLLILIFAQQIAFGGFEQLLSLFTLSELGLGASGNAIIFVFAGIIVVVVQGGLVGKWSRQWGDRRLVFTGLLALAIGLGVMAFTPQQPLPGYSRAAMQAELSQRENVAAHSNPTAGGDASNVALPPDGNTGWLGLIWLLAAMVPTAIGGGILQPAINSLITKRIEPGEVGGMLGISASLLSGANALAPLLGGLLFAAFSPRAPFVFWALIMLGLWLAARAAIKPGREEQLAAGLARGGAH